MGEGVTDGGNEASTRRSDSDNRKRRSDTGMT